jgi:hypothetical protein
MFMIFLLFVALKAEEEELKECQERRDSVERELSEPSFAVAEVGKECESSAEYLEARESIGEEKGNTSTKLTNTIYDPITNNYQMNDMEDSMSEEISFEAKSITGECGAPQ